MRAQITTVIIHIYNTVTTTLHRCKLTYDFNADETQVNSAIKARMQDRHTCGIESGT